MLSFHFSFCFSCSTGSLGNTLQKISSSPFAILVLSYTPFVLRYLLDFVLERSWADSGFRVSAAPAQPRGGTHCAELQRPETHKTPTAEEKRKSHCTSLCASLSWKYSPPKEQGKHKGILCCVSLPASGQLWVLDTNSCHRSWDFSLQPSSSASLHKDHPWFVPPLSFTALHLDSPKGTWILGITENPGCWGCWRKLQCHTCAVEDSKCHCYSTAPARCDVKHCRE